MVFIVFRLSHFDCAFGQFKFLYIMNIKQFAILNDVICIQSILITSTLTSLAARHGLGKLSEVLLH